MSSSRSDVSKQFIAGAGQMQQVTACAMNLRDWKPWAAGQECSDWRDRVDWTDQHFSPFGEGLEVNGEINFGSGGGADGDSNT